MTKKTGRRFEFEEHKYAPDERRAIWVQRIREAMRELIRVIKTPPPLTFTMQVEVPKDDPRYENATLEETVIFMDTKLQMNPDGTFKLAPNE